MASGNRPRFWGGGCGPSGLFLCTGSFYVDLAAVCERQQSLVWAFAGAGSGKLPFLSCVYPDREIYPGSSMDFPAVSGKLLS